MGPVVVAAQAGALGRAGLAELADEGLCPLSVLGPDRAVALVVGGLRAAGRVAHSDERAVGRGGAGELEAECAGWVGEPAVVRRPQVQDAGALGQQVEDVTVVVLGLRRCRGGCAEAGVDAGEELGEAPGSGAGGQDALLVVAELGQDQAEVAVAFVLVDLGQQLGLRAAGAGGIAFGRGDGDVLQV